LVSPGKLVFDLPKILSDNLPSLHNILFLYLIDELENLKEEQQKYIQTLTRETKPPCSIKTGSRLYGILTMETLSGEENKQGAEYQKLFVDSFFREKTKKGYNQFISDLCLKRLENSQIYADLNSDSSNSQKFLSGYFEHNSIGKFGKNATQFIQEKNSADREYFRKLREKLLEGKKAGVTRGINSDNDIDKIIENLSVPEYPLLEKVNIHVFYQDGFDNKKSLLEISKIISTHCKEYISGSSDNSDYSQKYAHWHRDLLAQLYKEHKKRINYSGLKTLIDMSDGIPRNLLMILKFIYEWAVFHDEKPFEEGARISIKSQIKGVKEASEWFFEDARPSRGKGKIVRDSINRLGQFFKEFRYSDKPSEVSLNSFSVDLSQCSEQTQKTIELAEKWSLLVSVSGGQKYKNEKKVTAKYQLNKMLSPRWDLSIARRGTIPLTPEMVNSVFDPEYAKHFKENLNKKISRLTAPFFGKNRDKDEQSLKYSHKEDQLLFPGFQS
jgi:hypothetical protein